ncbi:MAG: hypothetical protein RLZZ08_756 [Pseudomonadota bacterium]|jgi:uncharacterized protein (DUF2141 family)
MTIAKMTSRPFPPLPAHQPARWALAAAVAIAAAGSSPALAEHGEVLRNDPAECRAGAGPAVRLSVTGIKAGTGSIRVQLYRGTKEDWLVSGRWLNRIEVPARAGEMNFCIPVPRPGNYAIAVRHDVNGNGETDIMQDGGAMSNNPSINIFNLGKPGVGKTVFPVGDDVKPMAVRMRYL